VLHIVRVRKLVLVVLAIMLLVAPYPMAAFAGGPNGKGKGHEKPAVEVTNKPAVHGNGKDNGQKATAGSGGYPTPTPTPTLVPIKDNGAKVIKDGWEVYSSSYYGCTHYTGYNSGRLQEVITQKKIVTYMIKSTGWNQGRDCSGYLFYRYEWEWKLKVIVDQTTGQRRLANDWYESEGFYYENPSKFRSHYIIIRDEVVLDQLWVLVDGKLVKLR